MRATLPILLLFALACSRGDEDTAAELLDTAVDDGREVTGCDVLEIGFDGEEEPSVGDAWTVWPICDGSPVFGAMVVQVDPTSCAAVSDGVVTWAESGSCELMVQSGSQRAYQTVDVQ